jgi:hypothetical protein
LADQRGQSIGCVATAWACALLGLQLPKLFAEIEKQSAWLVKEGNPQAVANTVCVCATLGLQSPKLCAEIEKNSILDNNALLSNIVCSWP